MKRIWTGRFADHVDMPRSALNPLNPPARQRAR